MVYPEQRKRQEENEEEIPLSILNYFQKLSEINPREFEKEYLYSPSQKLRQEDISLKSKPVTVFRPNKIFLVLFALLLSFLANAQDFKNIYTSNEAITQASILASKCSNSKLLNSQNFAEDNLFAVRFVTPELSANDYNKLDSEKQNLYLTVVFKTFDNTFAFNRVTGSYDAVFDIWKNYVSQTDLKDNQNKKYFDKDKKIMYLLSEGNDERWEITRKIQ